MEIRKKSVRSSVPKKPVKKKAVKRRVVLEPARPWRLKEIERAINMLRSA